MKLRGNKQLWKNKRQQLIMLGVVIMLMVFRVPMILANVLSKSMSKLLENFGADMTRHLTPAEFAVLLVVIIAAVIIVGLAPERKEKHKRGAI